MRVIPLSLAVLSLGCFVSSGEALAQVNLLHPPHHVHVTPKSTDQPASATTSTTAPPPAAATQVAAPPTAAAAPVSPAAPSQSTVAAAPPAPQV